jgi:hypothetical protein
MRDSRLWAALALALLLAAVLAGYYAVHKPVTPMQAAHLLGIALDLAAALWLTTVGGALGLRLLRWLPTAELWPGERAALAAALGWGALALALLALGFVGALTLPAVVALSSAVFLFLWREARAWWAEVRQGLRAFGGPGLWQRGCAAFVAVTLALGLFQALAPPLAWDALVYHLTLPRWYAELGHLRVDPVFMFSGFPQLNEMLFTAAHLLRGEIAAQTLGWAFGAVLALGLAGLAGRSLGAEWAATAPAILFSAHTIAISLAWAYAELLLMALALGVLIALDRWRRTSAPRWLAVAGALSGFALGCKYTGVIVPLAAFGVVALQTFQQTRTQYPALRTPRYTLLFFLLPLLLTSSPWLLKNWLFTGNPAYPLLFPTEWMDAWRLTFYNRPDLIERNPLNAALIFFRAVFLGVQGGNDYDATLGPLWVFLPLALALGWRLPTEERRRALWPLVVFCAAGYVGWVALMFVSKYAVQARLFFAMFPALAVLAAAGLAVLPGFDTPQLRLSFIARVLTGFVLVLGLVEHALYFGARSPLAYLAGAQSAGDYRRAQLGWHAAALERVNALPAGARVVFLWEPRSLECVSITRCAPDEIIDRWWHLRRTLGSADRILAAWQSAGFTHVLIADWGAEFVRVWRSDSLETPDDWAELEQLRARLTPVENFDGAYTLYALPAAP